MLGMLERMPPSQFWKGSPHPHHLLSEALCFLALLPEEGTPVAAAGGEEGEESRFISETGYQPVCYRCGPGHALLAGCGW